MWQTHHSEHQSRYPRAGSPAEYDEHPIGISDQSPADKLFKIVAHDVAENVNIVP